MPHFLSIFVVRRPRSPRAIGALVIALCISSCGPDFNGRSVASSHQCVVNGTRADQTADGSIMLLGTVEIIIADQLMCSGTLIDSNVVLSAAHCFADSHGAPLVDASEIRVAAGHVVHGGAGFEEYAVADFKIASDYNRDGSLGAVNDLAILILAEPIFYGPSPIAVLPPEMVDTALVPGTDVLVAGYGASALNDQGCPVNAGVLNFGTSTVRRVVGSDIETKVEAGEADTCNGDSGGPLYYHASDGTYFLAGIVSRGLSGSGPICGAGGIYTLASDYLGEIAAYVSSFE